MKKFILGAILLLFAGCAKIQTDGETITYSRFGSQNLSDVSFTKDGNGAVNVKIGKQESNDMGAALSAIEEAIKKIP
tara:strand:- start:733 stop:963 length:231 start_codon:yes stop_codon:yes gene_type:complete